MKKQEQKTKKTLSIIATFAIIAVLIIGGLIAYLTDTDQKENKFTIGSVDIVLNEPNWDTTDTNSNDVPDVTENIVANQVIAKDPQIQNIGNNPAYVYLKVTVPTATVNEADGSTTTNKQLFTYTTNSGWTEITAARNNDGTNNIYYYYYNNALPATGTDAEKTTAALFDEVKVTDMKNTNGIVTAQSIMVDAYAIQSNSLPSGTTVSNTEWVTSFTTGASGILTPTNSNNP